jgi:hypothetical protein
MTTCTCLYSNYPGGHSMESRDPACPVHGDNPGPAPEGVKE